jgi:fructose-specific phosphotransferase system IIC component
MQPLVAKFQSLVGGLFLGFYAMYIHRWNYVLTKMISLLRKIFINPHGRKPWG